eukprot:gene1353-1954_t
MRFSSHLQPSLCNLITALFLGTIPLFFPCLCSGARHKLITSTVLDNDVQDAAYIHLQAVGSNKWLVIDNDNPWMVWLTDWQPTEQEMFFVHRWGADQLQIRAPTGKWLWAEGGGNGGSVRATSEGDSVSSWETFYIEAVGDTQCRIRTADNVSYFSYPIGSDDMLRTGSITSEIFGTLLKQLPTQVFSLGHRLKEAQIAVAEGDTSRGTLFNVLRTTQRIEPVIRGVSFGGWLLLEKWISPTIFEYAEKEGPVSDQWTWFQRIERDKAKALLEYHYTHFINVEKDMKFLQDHNFTAVRVPVGYWMFATQEELDAEGAPYLAGGTEHLDALFRAADQSNIDVLLCLHGAPGSQNGLQVATWSHDAPGSQSAAQVATWSHGSPDSQGAAQVATWSHGSPGSEGAAQESGHATNAVNWTTDANMDATVDYIERMTRRFAGQEHLLGVGLLNEPDGNMSLATLRTFYSRAYERVMEVDSSLLVWMSDSWRAGALAGSASGVRHGKEASVQGLMRHRIVVAGEWALALHTSTWDGVDDATKKRMQTEYATAQMGAFEKGGGWFFWTYKIPEWSAVEAVELGMLTGHSDPCPECEKASWQCYWRYPGYIDHWESDAGLLRLRASGKWSKCLDAVDGGSQAGARVHLWDCVMFSPSQQWTYHPSSGYIRLTEHPQQCLDARVRPPDEAAATGQAYTVALMDCDLRAPSQHWTLSHSTGQLQVLGSSAVPWCLQGAEGWEGNGAAVQMAPCDDAAPEQAWDHSGAVHMIRQPGAAADGAGALCLDNEDGRLSAKNRIHVWDCLEESDSQRWLFHLGTGEIKLSTSSMKCISTEESSLGRASAPAAASEAAALGTSAGGLHLGDCSQDGTVPLTQQWEYSQELQQLRLAAAPPGTGCVVLQQEARAVHLGPCEPEAPTQHWQLQGWDLSADQLAVAESFEREWWQEPAMQEGSQSAALPDRAVPLGTSPPAPMNTAASASSARGGVSESVGSDGDPYSSSVKPHVAVRPAESVPLEHRLHRSSRRSRPPLPGAHHNTTAAVATRAANISKTVPINTTSAKKRGQPVQSSGMPLEQPKAELPAAMDVLSKAGGASARGSTTSSGGSASAPRLRGASIRGAPSTPASAPAPPMTTPSKRLGPSNGGHSKGFWWEAKSRASSATEAVATPESADKHHEEAANIYQYMLGAGRLGPTTVISALLPPAVLICAAYHWCHPPPIPAVHCSIFTPTMLPHLAPLRMAYAL